MKAFGRELTKQQSFDIIADAINIALNGTVIVIVLCGLIMSGLIGSAGAFKIFFGMAVCFGCGASFWWAVEGVKKIKEEVLKNGCKRKAD